MPTNVLIAAVEAAENILPVAAHEEKDDSNVIPDSSNICTNDNQVDQNATECVDERVVLANLIANLTLDTEENNKRTRLIVESIHIKFDEIKEMMSDHN
ncbi:hypothetical protein Tco_0288725 [Tanacetum coccineum]